MGIKEKGFAEWIATEFPGVVRPIGHNESSSFDTVCIDINALLHTCFRTSKTEPKFVKSLFNDLDRCLRLTRPRKTVYLAVDGSAPLAKMKEQIRRRKSRSPSKTSGMDSSQITPGCTFMIRVTEYLHYYAARYLSRKAHPDKSLRFIVDGAETHGEGEAKIMKFLCSSDGYVNKPVAVFSGDSDVIVQSLLNPVQDIYVLRPGLVNIAFYGVSVARLRAAVHKVTTPDASVMRDFALLIMFSGNDYVRKLRGGRISKIWPLYKKFIKEPAWSGRHLVSQHMQFDFEVLNELLKRIHTQTSRRVFKPDLTISLSMLGIVLPVDPPSNGTSSGDVVDEDEEEEDEEELREVDADQRRPNYTRHIPNYLQSLLWTLSMYATGHCPNFLFSQTGRYLTVEQLLTFIARDLSSTPPIRVPSTPGAQPLVTALCAMTLLDPTKAPLVPASWQPCFRNEGIRTRTYQMVHGAAPRTSVGIRSSGVSEEEARVMRLVQEIGRFLVDSVDVEDPLVHVLTYSQCPVVLSQTSSSSTRARTASTLRPIGTSHPEVWQGVSLALPVLDPDPSLDVRAYDGRTAAAARRKGGGEAGGGRRDRPGEWPFRARVARTVVVPAGGLERSTRHAK